MNKHQSTFILAAATILAASINAYAGEPSDSIQTSVQLNEVIVESQNQRVNTKMSVYTPDKKQKKSSQNAIDLLQQMGIPEISIDAVSNTAKSLSGETVKIFINYVEALENDIAGLKTDNVRRVEYLTFPTDPRFHGENHVINIIVENYNYGGYTKLAIEDSLLTGFSQNANVFSKFQYKNMTYDVFVASKNKNNHTDGEIIQSTFSLKNKESVNYELQRNQDLISSHCIRNTIPVTFRATYNNDNILINNTIGYTYDNKPVWSQSGNILYLPKSTSDKVYKWNNPTRSNSVSYSGMFYLKFPKNYSLNITPNFFYTYSNDRYSYDFSKSSIRRNAKENAYNYNVSASLQKIFKEKHIATLNVNSSEYINRINYSGTNFYHDKFNLFIVGGKLAYTFQTNILRLNVDAGFTLEKNKINSYKQTDMYPFSHVNLRYTPNSKNVFGFSLQYASASPGIAEKTPNILEENEYMYISGNPNLKNNRLITYNLLYTWMPHNNFSMSVNNNMFTIFDRALSVYELYNNGSALLRTFNNNGNYFNNSIAVAINLKLLDNKLQLSAQPVQSFYKSTGIYNKVYCPFTTSVNVSYYLNDFYFRAYYQTPYKMMEVYEPSIDKGQHFYYLTIGWAHAGWNVRFQALNFFNKGKGQTIMSTTSPLYHETKTTKNVAYCPRLSFSITYTIDYGKKINRNNEIGQQSGSASAILK